MGTFNGRPDNYASLVENYQARPIDEASTIEFNEGSRIRGDFHNGYSYAGVVNSKDGLMYNGTFDDGRGRFLLAKKPAGGGTPA